MYHEDGVFVHRASAMLGTYYERIIVPDPLSHRSSARRNQRGPRQYDKRRLEMAHVRHSKGIGLAW